MDPRNSSVAVDRGLSILEALAESPNGLTHAQISRRAGIPKSSATYILRALEQRGYVQRGSKARLYRLGIQALGLSRGLEGSAELTRAARPVLVALVERAQLSSHLGVREGERAVCVSREEGPGLIRIDTRVGGRLSLHSSGAGKALLSALGPEELDSLLGERDLERMTSRTITTFSALEAELQKVREQGFAVEDEENAMGVRCVAAPVSDARGAVVAAIAVAGTTTQISRATLPVLAGHVRGAARELSRQLGWGGGSEGVAGAPGAA